MGFSHEAREFMVAGVAIEAMQAGTGRSRIEDEAQVGASGAGNPSAIGDEARAVAT